MKSLVAIAVSVLACLQPLGLTASPVDINDVTIVVGEQFTWIENRAAGELQKYVELMTGARWRILKTSDGLPEGSFIVAIGREDTNPIVKKIIEAGKIRLSNGFPGQDGFIVQSVSLDEHDYLIIGGSQDIGTLYGVYHYLEESCDCGFFADGEHIPKRKDVPLKNIDYVEKARLKWRCWNSDIGHWVIKKYQSRFWSHKEWFNQLDWMAKRKMNMTFYTLTPSFNLVGSTILRTYGMGPRQPEEVYGGGWPVAWNWPDEYREELTKDVLAYARARGVKVAYLFGFGDIPPGFDKKYPDKAKWLGPDSYDQVSIHPDDPLAYELTRKYVKEIIRTFGTDHIYGVGPYVEFAVSDDPKVALRVKTDAMKKTCEVLAQIDPDWILLTNAWDFICHWGTIWTPESVTEYLSALPQERMILSSDSEDMWDKLYKKCNYYGKVTWAFGALHSFAGDDEWHNGHKDLLRRIREVVREESPNPCQGIFMVPELTNCDILYWHLMTWLGWNPERVQYEDAVRRYCQLRYGAANGKKMARAWLTFLSALPDFGQHRRLYNNPKDSVNLKVAAERYLPGLKRGLGLALAQAPRLKENPLYITDLFYFARDYAGNMFNYQYTLAKQAAEQKDLELFDRASANALQCMTVLERLLSTRPDLSLQRMIDEVMAVPGTNPYVPKMIRQACVNWDYCNNDVYEQFRFYYRPKVEGFLQKLRKQIETGEVNTDYKAVFSEEDEALRKRWVNEGFDLTQLQPFEGTTLEAVIWANKTIKSLEAEKTSSFVAKER